MGLGRLAWWAALSFLGAGCGQAHLGEPAFDLHAQDATIEDARALEDTAIPHSDSAIDTGIQSHDAGSDAQEPVDAGCRSADPDDDGVCSSQDNCPSTANPDQADGDHDGMGDICDDEPCGIQPFDDQAILDIGRVTAGAINGGNHIAYMDPGETFEVTFSYELSLCVPGVGVVFTHPLQVGFEDQPMAQCTVTHTCNLMPSTGNAHHMFQAPNVPGPHVIRVRLTEGPIPICVANTSSAWFNDSPTDAPIAAICVRVLH